MLISGSYSVYEEDQLIRDELSLAEVIAFVVLRINPLLSLQVKDYVDEDDEHYLSHAYAALMKLFSDNSDYVTVLEGAVAVTPDAEASFGESDQIVVKQTARS